MLPTMLRRRSFCAALAGAALGEAHAAPAARPDFGAAIDLAGRQRMLTQRIVKAYCQVGLKVAPEVSRAQLADALRRFEASQAAIGRAAPDAATRRALQRSTAAFAPLRGTASAAIERTRALRLHGQGEAALAAAHEVVVALQAAAGTPQARLVNIAGRQRMLSQRLAKLYMLRAWSIELPDLRDQMDIAVHEFAGALEVLRNAPENTTALTRELEAVALQWEWFAGAIGEQGAFGYALLVADASESILSSMDLVTGMYAELARG